MNQRPRKRFGQNFLTDTYTMQRIVASLRLSADSLIVEIGPGKGALTRYLLESGHQYVGIEIDRNLASVLRREFSSNANFSLLEGDVLDLDLPTFLANHADKKVSIIGNIPYNITSPILFQLFENHNYLYEAVIMMQREVALRIAADPGGKLFGLLAINSKIYTEAEYLFSVGAGLFYPKPKVDSAVCRFTFKRDALQDFPDFALFQRIIRTAFQHRRKMLRKSLSMLFPAELLSKLDADLTLRPERLSLEDWKKLADCAYMLQQEGQHDSNET
ncbi:MAG: 16S rRNA (adenine(1518)-N(6)/adenine(1519)-N(6))-dimethyltransferase RsmA [Calditrichia bacterium]